MNFKKEEMEHNTEEISKFKLINQMAKDSKFSKENPYMKGFLIMDNTMDLGEQYQAKEKFIKDNLVWIRCMVRDFSLGQMAEYTKVIGIIIEK